jgi:hypothetical protein
MIEVGKSLISIDSNTGGNPAPCSPDLLFNGSNQGTVDGSQNILVNMEDLGGNPASPVSVALVGNTLTIVVDIDTELFFNGTLKGSITDGTPINVNLQSSGGIQQTPISSTLSGNTLTIVIDIDTDIAVNSTIVGSVIDGLLINILPVDSITNLPITPTSTILAGNNLTIGIATGTASGVAFKVPPNGQTTQYATGATPEDEGWRWINGFWNYVAPTTPKAVAELDYSLSGNNFWYRLQQPLTVAGVTSTVRFVDIDGGQTWSTTGNRHWVTIDKLTGLMFIRLRDQAPVSQSVWQTMIDLCAALSLTVAGNTYADWYMPSLTEMAFLFGGVRTSTNWIDPVTSPSVNIMTGSSSTWNTGVYWTATTRPDLTTAVQMHRADTTFSMFGALSQNKSGGAAVPCVPIRQCRSLITAP